MNPTPTRHGNWHVIDGVLTDLDAIQGEPIKQTTTPVVASPELRTAKPGAALPPADAPATTTASTGRKSQNKE